VEATGESHLHRIVLFTPHLLGGMIGIAVFLECIPSRIHRPAVSLGDGSDVLGRLQATLNLQRLYPGAN